MARTSAPGLPVWPQAWRNNVGPSARAALGAALSEARTAHYASPCPGTTMGRGFSPSSTQFTEDYDSQVEQPWPDLGKLFRIEEYPSKEDLRDRVSIRHGITPVSDAEHFIANLASDDTDRVKRDIDRHIEEQLHDSVGDLYRRLTEAVEPLSERSNEDGDGKLLSFRDTVISNIQDLLDMVPGLNIFGDQRRVSCEKNGSVRFWT